MTDWDMVVETFPNGRHNFPKVTPKNREHRAQPVHDDGEVGACARAASSPTRITARRGAPSRAISTVQLVKSGPTNDYRGRASFSNGTMKIHVLRAVPRRTCSRASRSIGGKVHFDRIDLVSDGARSVITGDVDLARWPEQLYQIRSQIDFPTQKNIFFHRDSSPCPARRLQGTFHLFKGGRELKGTFTSPVAGVNDWRFPNLRGSVLWLPDRLEITNATSELYGGDRALRLSHGAARQAGHADARDLGRAVSRTSISRA